MLPLWNLKGKVKYVATLTIKIIDVTEGVDWENNPCQYAKFTVEEWPDLGPWDILIPLAYTKAQAKIAIEAFVHDLAVNHHSWYGTTWSMTV